MNRQYSTRLILPKIEAQLLPDERLLWLGKPSWRRLLTGPNFSIGPIGIVTGILVVLMMAGIVLTRTSDTLALSGFLVLTLFILIILIPTIIQYFVAENTIYGVTTHRAIIIEGSKLTSFGAADINVRECDDANDGTGDVIFKKVMRERMIPTDFLPSSAEVEEKVGFFGIPNPRHVHELLLHTFRNSPVRMWQDKTFATPHDTAKAQA